MRCGNNKESSRNTERDRAQLHALVLFWRGEDSVPIGHSASRHLLSRLPSNIHIQQPILIMSELQLVVEIEKYPCLYNFQLADYSRKDITDRSWKLVAEKRRLTGM